MAMHCRYIDFVEFMVIFYIMADGTAEEVENRLTFFSVLKYFLRCLGKSFACSTSTATATSQIKR